MWSLRYVKFAYLYVEKTNKTISGNRREECCGLSKKNQKMIVA